MSVMQFPSSSENVHAILTEWHDSPQLQLITRPRSDIAPNGWVNGDPLNSPAVTNEEKPREYVKFKYNPDSTEHDGFTITRKQERVLFGNLHFIQRLNPDGTQIDPKKIKHVISWKGPFNRAHFGVQGSGALGTMIYKNGKVIVDSYYPILGACTLYISDKLHLFWCAVVEGTYAVPIFGATNESPKIAFYYKNLEVENSTTLTIKTPLDVQYTLRVQIASPMFFSDSGLQSECTAITPREVILLQGNESIPIYNPHNIGFNFTVENGLITATVASHLVQNDFVADSENKYLTFKAPNPYPTANDVKFNTGCAFKDRKFYFTNESKYFVRDYAIPTAAPIYPIYTPESSNQGVTVPSSLTFNGVNENRWNGAYWHFREVKKDTDITQSAADSSVAEQEFAVYTRSHSCDGLITVRSGGQPYKKTENKYYNRKTRYKLQDTSLTYRTSGGQYAIQQYGYNGNQLTIENDNPLIFNGLRETVADPLDNEILSFHMDLGSENQANPLRIVNILTPVYSAGDFWYGTAGYSEYLNNNISCASKTEQYTAADYGFVFSTIYNPVSKAYYGPENHKPDPPSGGEAICEYYPSPPYPPQTAKIKSWTASYQIISGYDPPTFTYSPPLPTTTSSASMVEANFNEEKRALFVLCDAKHGFYVYIQDDKLLISRKAGYPAFTFTLPIKNIVTRNDRAEFGMSFINDTGGYPGIFAGDIWKKEKESPDDPPGIWEGKFPVNYSYDQFGCLFFSMIVPMGNEVFYSVSLLANNKTSPQLLTSNMYGYCTLSDAYGDNVLFEEIGLV